jgi:flagellar biogenesis protein FliO
MRVHLSLAIILVLLSNLTSAAPVQATQPTAPAPAAPAATASADPYENIHLPPRHGAATQSTTGAMTPHTSTAVFDTRRLILALAIVLAAIFVSQQVWKRVGMPGAPGRASGALQVVSRLNIAPRQQVLLIRVGRRLVLIANSGTQMNPLCEIDDAEEAALLLGQTAVERQSSMTSSFNAVLTGEEKAFDEQLRPQQPTPEADPEEEAALATTRDEISGLMEKVRGLSRQFGRG